MVPNAAIFSEEIQAYLRFTVTIASSLSVQTLAEYQTSLPEKTIERRASGLNDKQIARVLKREGYRTPRGKTFTANQVWPMRKKHAAGRNDKTINQSWNMDRLAWNMWIIHSPI